jgi:hypothetical protein
VRSLEKLPAVPLMAERGFDAVGLMQWVKELGCSVAIGVKETWRARVRSLLRPESQQGWKKYGREQYRVEGVFGVLKQKGVVVGGGAGGDGMSGGVVVQPVHAGGERLSGWFFLSSCFGFFWLISAFFWRLCFRKIAYNVRL